MNQVEQEHLRGQILREAYAHAMHGLSEKYPDAGGERVPDPRYVGGYRHVPHIITTDEERIAWEHPMLLQRLISEQDQREIKARKALRADRNGRIK